MQKGENIYSVLRYGTHIQRWSTRLLIALAVCFACFISNTNAQDDDLSKAQKLKAAFLYNFIKFVEWPAELSPVAQHKVGICIMGDNPFGSSLDVLKAGLSGKMVVNITPNATASDMGQCNVVFISDDGGNLDAVLAEARKHSVLTVSEATDFADNGGVIEMKTVQKSVGLFSSNKINLRINLKAAEASGLRISAQLLEISAEVIK